GQRPPALAAGGCGGGAPGALLADSAVGAARQGLRRHHVQLRASVGRGAGRDKRRLRLRRLGLHGPRAFKAEALPAITNENLWRIFTVTILMSILGSKALGFF